MARKNASFGPEFWQALRRIQAEAATSKYPNRGWWVPTDDVWPYREFNRHEDNVGYFGGTAETVENTDDLANSMRKHGQFDPGHLLYDPDAVDMSKQGLYGMHLGEGNHRVAAARKLGSPHFLVEFSRSSRKPNRERKHGADSTPGGVRRGVTAKESILPNQFNYVPGNATPNDFVEFEGKGIRADTGRGSPSDRSIVKAMGHVGAAKRLLDGMKTAGKVLGPIAAVVGLASGMQDPAEALGATVDKAEGNNWAEKKYYTPAVKKAEKKYYADKRQKAIDSNPLSTILQKQGKLK